MGSCLGRASSESPAQIESKPRSEARIAASIIGRTEGLELIIRSRVGKRYPSLRAMTQLFHAEVNAALFARDYKTLVVSST